MPSRNGSGRPTVSGCPQAGVIKAASRSNQSIYSLIDCFADNPLQALQ